MSNRDYLGEFEQLTLLAACRLGNDAYGTTIKREIEEHTGRPTSIGALYTTLSRLEQKGLVSSCLGEVTPERGGRAKRFYEVTPSGRELLSKSLKALTKLSDGFLIWGTR
jgi:DNA-binding PadR family transcriptional regulator